jgi:lipopolysaccharide export system permease protein
VFGLLHRKIFMELAKVFLLSLIGLTLIIVMAAIVQEASQHGLGPEHILTAIMLLVPSMMPFIIPPTTLFACCVVYGRLAHDNEITAIKAAGINVLYVVLPGIALGLATSLATLGLYIDLIPYTHRLLRTAVANDVEEFLYSMLKRDRELHRPDLRLSYEMYVKQVQGKRLKWAVFMRKNPKGDYDLIACAREAELTVDPVKNEVIVHMINGNCITETNSDRVHFDQHSWNVPMPELKSSANVSCRDMRWGELMQARAEQMKKIQGETISIDLLLSQQWLNAAPLNLPQNIANHENILKREKGILNTIDTELNMRPALSFGCLFFVLVGCPVGIWFSRSDYLSAFITCFLPIVFLYYPLQLCSINLAKDGKLDTTLGVWLADAVMGLMAAALFRKLVKN